MSVQLILKNSSVEDKRPTSAQLADGGEISLNYNEAGAFLCCKDSAGNIQQVGGVKISDVAPDNPVKQTLWFDPKAFKLFIHDGDTWLPVSSGGGGGGGGDITTIIGNDGIDASESGGVVTLELDLAGGDDGLEFKASKLSASLASATQLGSVKVGDNIAVTTGTISVPAATASTLGVVKIGNGIDIDSDGEISVDIPQTLNYRGSCLLNATPTGQINPNPPVVGDAYINGVDTSSINAGWTGLSGAANTGDIVVWDGTEWELIGTGGSQYWDRTGTILSPAVAGDKVQSASTIDSDPDATLVTKDYLEDQRVTTSDTAPVAGDSRDGDLWWNTNDGRLYVYYEDADSSQWVDASPDSQVSSEYWKRIAGPYLAPDNDGDGIDINGGNIQLKADGSITAAGEVAIDEAPSGANQQGGRLVLGTVVGEALGDITTERMDLSYRGNMVFKTHQNPSGALTTALTLDYDQNASFTGSVKIGGTMPSSPNIELKADGSITAGTFNEIYINKGANNITSNLAIGNSTTLVDPALSGTLNVGIGNNALSSVTTGQANVALGSGTLSLNTTGINNIALAFNALANNVDGDSNFAGGRGALRANVDGSYNIAFGTDTFSANVNGSRNLALGVQAGQFIEGSNNTILGSYTGSTNQTLNDTIILAAGQAEKLRIDDTGSLLFGGTIPSSPNITLANNGNITAGRYNNINISRGNNDLSSNVAVGGSGILGSITTGAQNCAFGQNAMSLNTEGGKNTAVGNSTLNNNATGNYNTAIGQLALAASLADSNTGIGMSALKTVSTGPNNTAVGKDAGWSLLSGTRNTFLGYRAGYYIEGSANTILGGYQGSAADSTLSHTIILSAGAVEKLRIDSTGSLLFGGTLPSAPAIELNADGTITAGTYNGLNVDAPTSQSTALGIDALRNITTGPANTAVGNRALRNQLTGEANVAVGYQALLLASASNNTAIGYNSLVSLTIGTKNCAVGHQALQGIVEGENNVAIGYKSGTTFTGSNNTILGPYVGTESDATLSDTVVIAAGTTERARCDSNGDWDFNSIILKSPDGTSFRLSVANDGALSASAI